MHTETTSPQTSYDANRLLDMLIEMFKLKNDAALARKLEVAPAVISKIRHRTLTIGATMLLRMHDVSQLTIRDLRNMIGEQQPSGQH